MSLNTLLQMAQDLQRTFHDRIAFDLHALHDGGSIYALGTLATAGFLYGIFHAIGPGHGKVIISGYMLADDHSIKRGLIITALSSLLQAIVAIALVLGLFYGLGLARSETEYAAAWFECLSFALVAIIGMTLLLRGLRQLNHRHDCGCGHDHTADIKNSHRLSATISIIASIGIRPCSGALILMFFAALVGEIWAGIAATVTMAIGTAITTGTIAVVAATSRKGLLKLVGKSEATLALTSAIIKIIGGLLIALLGTMFFYTSLPAQSALAPYNHPLIKRD